MQPGDRVAYVQRVGYGVEYLLGTVTDVMPACGGPVGLFIRWGK